MPNIKKLITYLIIIIGILTIIGCNQQKPIPEDIFDIKVLDNKVTIKNITDEKLLDVEVTIYKRNKGYNSVNPIDPSKILLTKMIDKISVDEKLNYSFSSDDGLALFIKGYYKDINIENRFMIEHPITPFP